MRRISPSVCALTVGSVIGFWHLAWAVLVASGAAKAFMDFVLRLHFLEFSYTLAPFQLSTAAMLVGLTFAIGFVLGLIFALVWNWLAGSEARGLTGSGRPIGTSA